MIRAILIFLIAFQGVSVADDTQLLNLPETETERVPRTERIWPASSDEAHICLWRDDKLAAFSITIDDNNRPDHDGWLELSEKYGWKWTWFVITKRVDEELNPGFAGVWSDWQRLIDAGQDVQSHTQMHLSKKQEKPLSCEQEYAGSLASLRANLQNQKFMTLAYPGGGLPNDPAVAARHYIGARSTVGHLNHPCKINYLKTNSLSRAVSFFKEEEHWASFAGMLNPANERKYRAWMCTHYHGVKDWSSVTDMLDVIKEHEADVWVGTFTDVVRYGQERDTATVEISANDDATYAITVSDRMSDSYFDLPLTVKWRLPDGWTDCTAIQGGQACEVTITSHDGAQYALISIVPDQGAATIRQHKKS